MSFLGLLARIVVFPWGLFRLVTWPTRPFRPTEGRRAASFGWAVFDLGVFALLIVPATFVILMELVIAANNSVGREYVDYRVPSDFEVDVTALARLPGTPEPDAGTADPTAFGTEEERHALALRYAPVILLETAYRPDWDLPIAVDLDGNWDPRDNPAALERLDSVPAVVYGELTAVTRDALYFTYTLYRARDYDHPIRQWITHHTHHDSDNEGFHVRVNRATGAVESAETWFHNRFLVCNLTGVSWGTEVVRGRLHLEGNRPVIFSQSQGHGLRCAQSSDLDRIDDLKVLRPSPDGRADVPRRDEAGEANLRYRLDGFQEWYTRASRPDDDPMYAESIELGPGLVVGRYISGLDRENVGVWARPKPMWAWDDKLDTIPVAVWHFLPSFSFEAHEGGTLSHDYVFNGPAASIFGISGNELRDRLDLEPEYDEGQTWEEARRASGNDGFTVWGVARRLITSYGTRVFMALG
ncbi:MAG TPA: hypothetical protein VK858_05530 [Longimicrobiales bacterium]|nr:hypothetical protein [Longimicrobiales bacterium]